MTERSRVGCYPGSFDPPTVAHLAVAEAAVAAGRLHRVDLVLSRAALGKDVVSTAELDRRRAILDRVAASRSWLGVVLSEHRLIADLARGYDAVVMGADKWRQVTDPVWYEGSIRQRDAALARLPHVLVAPRATDDLVDLRTAGSPPGPGASSTERTTDQTADRPEPARRWPPVTVLEFDGRHRRVSSSAIRNQEPAAERWRLPDVTPPDTT